MLTADQIEAADRLLGEGKSEQEVSLALGLSSVSTLRYRLSQSGKRIRTRRWIEDIIPVQTEQTAALAG